MKKIHIISILSVLAVSLVGCEPPSEYCTVKGSIQGAKDGAGHVHGCDRNGPE